MNIRPNFNLLSCRFSHCNFFFAANRSEPTLDDLARSFEKNKVTLVELEEFINSVDTPEFSLKKHVSQPNDALFVQSSTKQWGDLVLDTSAPTSSSSKQQRARKTTREYLGYCDDPSNKELLDRLSDEENEYVYDYFPLMVRPLQAVAASVAGN